MKTQPMMTDPTIEAMLDGIKAPNLPLGLIRARVAEIYGLTGEWKQLGGEREQNFRLTTADGEAFVVKIASPSEPVESLRFQTEALEHIESVDPGFVAPRLRRTLSGEAMSHILDEAGESHVLRVLTFVKGEILFDQLAETGRSLGAEDLFALGHANGRLARALRGFAGRGASSVMPWDIRSGLLFSPAVHAHMPATLKPILDRLLTHISDVLSKQLPKLRAQVIYNDFHESNVLVKFGPSLSVEGVIDFGDMIFGPVAQDLAVMVASLIHWTPDPVFAATCLVRGYQRSTPLEQDDLAILRNLVLARLLLQVGLVAYQTAVHGRENEGLELLQELYIQAILKIAAVSDADFIKGVMPSVVPVSEAVPASPAALSTPALLERRQAVLGKTYMFYNEPLELVRGRGCMLYDAAGKEYLDCYNNVANVGHCHPYVLDALTRQAATLNTNSRYLHPEIVRLGERLSATLPAHLDTLVFVCTGSEANDLAVRMARLISGSEGVVITENSYHGNTTTVAPLSLIDYDIKDKPGWVATVPPPNLYRGLYGQDVNDAGRRYAEHVTQAAQKLVADGPGMAALMIDSIFDANGALVPPPDYMPLAYEAAKKAGALVIADEVQMGFGRSGTHMWGFEAFGVQPDIVTMGKPMGNGHPVAAVATRRDIAEVLQKQTGYFNTFGGNTVSAAVANACLDVLIGEDLQGNAARSGTWLMKELNGLMQRHEIIGHIQGRGLFLGVELVTDRTTRGPAKFAARWVRERMKMLGVLVSSTGPHGNIIKIRPPLVFSLADAARCLETLDRALSEVPADLRTVAA
ncbi:aminotransferase class III-fold pyridoxal phosphate-dependent enzyme [Rhizobium oryzicola]|uniref:Aminotransferase class III-fold pyridoxal phosphate-dependent enzyme n=1 Tax=Rhizobium oryzicola TaxID=1232668 RepID=A0ABT8SZD0_9HYPH|nr:aminotransferase class III-fold pyridoxal phosphate-dependent enzyme [Rhizobium oryzicola]MDO1583341.1 aminotransferase class III-fold pyridoxal phosphate-dependent enzyme [Rhizobium oryzicola]